MKLTSCLQNRTHCVTLFSNHLHRSIKSLSSFRFSVSRHPKQIKFHHACISTSMSPQFLTVCEYSGQVSNPVLCFSAVYTTKKILQIQACSPRGSSSIYDYHYFLPLLAISGMMSWKPSECWRVLTVCKVWTSFNFSVNIPSYMTLIMTSALETWANSRKPTPSQQPSKSLSSSKFQYNNPFQRHI